jgi:valyl-tRNA synthetase
MPFITEAIWEALRTASGQVATDELLATARWPQSGGRDASSEKEFGALAHLVRAVRNARLESGVPAGKRVPLELLTDGPQHAANVEGEARYVEALARVQPFTIHAPGTAMPPTTGAIATPFGPAWLQSDDRGDAGAQRRSNERERLRQSIVRLKALLANTDFTSKAPAAVVERERSRLRELEDALRQLGG